MSHASRENIVLIPRPEKIEWLGGHFQIDNETSILFHPTSEALKKIAQLLAEELGKSAPQSTNTEQTRNSISLRQIDDTALGTEGFRLNVSEHGIIIEANAPNGVFYGLQTLRQLLVEKEIPSVAIEDRPRFAFRGFMLDAGRHFYTVEQTKRIIDLISRYKYNRFHWHLTEDQGWRLEIKKHPRLTEIGAWRTGEGNDDYPAGTKLGGFYTQDDAREIVRYATERQIEVIPEIEMPGHSQAVLAAYPELSCTGGPFAVSKRWGIHDDVYCAGNEKVYDLLRDVLDETLEIFPFRQIHIGGDECRKTRWQSCPKCQDRMKQRGLADEKALQSDFIKTMSAYLQERGREVICWDEVLQDGLGQGFIVQEWRGHAPDGYAARAARMHLQAIVSPRQHWYLNTPVVPNPTKRMHPNHHEDLKASYDVDPIPTGLEPEFHKYIIGGEACLWTETIPPRRSDYFIFPRALAAAEVLWSPAQGKDFDEFAARVKKHYPRLEALGVQYGPGMAEEYEHRYDPGHDCYELIPV